MKPGYYWARHTVRGWRIVEAVKGLYDCVLEGGYAVKADEYSEFEPVAGPSAQAQIDSLTDRNGAAVKNLQLQIERDDLIDKLDAAGWPITKRR